tara:strand:- start:322 stop:555 length:234 start_codon:yes stop_codon:yes gene_type:complete
MKINRNNDCPCGSTKKFKNCCGQVQNKTPFYKNKLHLLFLIIGIFCIGITIATIIQKPLTNPEETEKTWCVNCQTYH